MIYIKIVPNTNLGNWMFQYAVAKTLQDECVALIENATLRGKFKRQLKKDNFSDIFRDIEVLESASVDARVFVQDKFSYTALPEDLKTGDWVLDGFFQSEKFFDKEMMRKLFACTADREHYLQKKYGGWLAKPEVCGISIRKGKDYQEQCHMHPFVGEPYLRSGVARMKELGARHFIVCSDNIPWCKDFFTNANFPDCQFLFVEGEKVLDQLYIHSLCKHNIISNSSFSWWGAWLNGNEKKVVIAPRKWFGPFAVWRGIDWRDIYYDAVEILSSPSTVGENLKAYWKTIWLVVKIRYVALRRKIFGR